MNRLRQIIAVKLIVESLDKCESFPASSVAGIFSETPTVCLSGGSTEVCLLSEVTTDNM